ncbi:MAG: hypothetical protein JSU75_09885 [Gammaproteobacteria bacterium]|nr:MAG: hypothetical protein JSU75_09885 [Gammaproteobacteria bacterium]
MKYSYPSLALGLGIVLGLVLLRFGTSPGGEGMPLLAALLMSEFGFLVTAIAAGLGIRDLVTRGRQSAIWLLLAGNLVLAANFLRMGLLFWSQASG